MQKKKISNGTLAAIIVLAIIIADQVIKIWVKTSFRLGESMPFTNWLNCISSRTRAWRLE